MKTTLMIASLVICLLCAGFTFQSGPRAYEYKFESAPSEKRTNELAGQGWELAAVESAGAGRITPTYIFRRPR